MSETKDLSFLIDSPEYRQNATFVTACYKEMLDRDVEAEELFRWCRQLDGIYSRKSVIAALSDSVKFNNRFEIKDIESYKKSAFIPRAIQFFINKLNKGIDGYDKGCFGELPIANIEFGIPKYERVTHTWSDELDMLSLCQIETLRERVRLLSERFGGIRTVGTIADDIVDLPTEASNTAFVTSVDYIVRLIEDADSELNNVNNLILPIPVPTNKGLSVIFDKNWSGITKGKSPRRWLVNRKEGGILFLNKHEYPVKVRLAFNLTVLVNGASVKISQGQNCQMVALRKKAARVTLSTVMLPGENIMKFQFVGTSDKSTEITNVAISRMSIDGDECSMTDDMNRLGTGYYSVAVPDSKVRNALHNAGYSEIECFRLFHDNSIEIEKTTRFLQHDPNSSGDSFYVLNEGDSQKNGSVSVRLYIAKKTGEINEYSIDR